MCKKVARNGLASKVKKSRKQMKERKKIAKETCGVKKVEGRWCEKGGKKQNKK